RPASTLSPPIATGEAATTRRRIRSTSGGQTRPTVSSTITRCEARGLAPRKPGRAGGERDDGQRQSDLEIGPEADRRPFRASLFGDDQVGHRSKKREVAGKRRAHRDDAPGALGIGK